MKIVYFAPNGFDYASSQLTEGLWLLQKQTALVDTLMVTNKMVHHGAKLDDLELTSVEEARDNVHDADMIIFSTGGDLTFAKDLLPPILSEKKLAKKVVFVDGHDSNQYLIQPDAVKLYLKRELRFPEATMLAWNNVRGFTFGVYDFHLDRVQPMYDERDVDVSFVAFGGSSTLRKDCVTALNEAKAAGQLKSVTALAPGDCQPLSIPEYAALMRRSKVIVNVIGAGIDTLRFWEAMGYGGILCSLDIQQRLFIRNCPEPRRHAMYFHSWKQMVEMCALVVESSHRWSVMRRATDEFIRCFHTTKRRAEQMIQLFRELG